ncbi:hypothetical protein MES5069_280021 [Mesorhizobium escarrei]|uniref:Uncharacterized protein n=1 Tax=Mesorhizobium escarrei TaxID=666018 RepID=A0ABM9DWW4_9HYPH|nr:hypothetical protein MES5069_280021 [Mesorhizobium escarrei]
MHNLKLQSGSRLEFQRDPVDAIAQAGRRRAVLEDVAEMAAAAGAVAFGADHAVAAVDGRLDRTGHRIVEAWPAGAALELQLGFEQGLVAADAGKSAGALLVEQGAAARPLGAVITHHRILLRRQPGAPFGIGAGDRVGVTIHFCLLARAAIGVVFPSSPKIGICYGVCRYFQCCREEFLRRSLRDTAQQTLQMPSLHRR